MYVLVRKDLGAEQIVVQAAHATIESARNFITRDSEHPHLVICGIATEKKLLTEADRLRIMGVKLKVFREADKNNEATALATEIIFGEARKVFRKYQLLKL